MKLEIAIARALLAIWLTLTCAMSPAPALADDLDPGAPAELRGSDDEAALPLQAEDTSAAQAQLGSREPVESPVSGWMQDADRRAQEEIAQAMAERRAALARDERVSAMPPAFLVRNRINKELLTNFDGLGRPLTGAEQFDRDNLRRFDDLEQTTMADEVASYEAPRTRQQLLQLLTTKGQDGQQLDPYTKNSAEWLYWQCYASPWVDFTRAQSEREGGNGPASRFLQQMQAREIPTYSTYGANELSAQFGEESEPSRIFQRYRNQARTIRDAQQAESNWQQASLWSDPIDYWNTWRARPDLPKLYAQRQQLEQEFLERAYLPGQDRRARY